MDKNQALALLFDRMSATGKPVHVGYDEVLEWQVGALEGLIAFGVLSKSVDAKSLQCMACEHHCFMDVLLTEDEQRAFIVCDQPEMQSQMGRIKVPLERLQQWQASPKKIAGVVAKLLGFENAPDNQKNRAVYRLGMLKAKKGRRWVSITVKPLTIEVNGHIVPLDELMYFDGGDLLIDWARINTVLHLAAARNSKAYTPDTIKREKRNLDTQAMYQDWHDEYVKRKQDPKNKNRVGFDSWCALEIAKLPIAQGRNSETIRKNMN